MARPRLARSEDENVDNKPSSKKTRGKAAKPQVLSSPVNFGSMTRGKNTCGIGLSFERGKITDAEADYYLLGAQVKVTMRADPATPKKEAKGQKRLINTDKAYLEAMGQITKYTNSESHRTARITFPIDAIDPMALWNSACSPGTIEMIRTGAADATLVDPDDEEQMEQMGLDEIDPDEDEG